MSYLNGNNQYLNDSYDDEVFTTESYDDEAFNNVYDNDESYDDEAFNITKIIGGIAAGVNRAANSVGSHVTNAIKRVSHIPNFTLPVGTALSGTVRTNTGVATVALPQGVANEKQVNELSNYVKSTIAAQSKSIADLGASVNKLNAENAKLAKVEANVFKTINERVKELKTANEGIQMQSMMQMLTKPSLESLTFKTSTITPGIANQISNTKFKDDNTMLMMMAMSGGFGGGSSSNSMLPMMLMMGNSGSGSNDMLPLILMLSMNKK